jgi:CMP/dCMP kinase
MARALTIDGPVGAGGTSLAKELEKELGIQGVPTSLFYRGYSEALRGHGFVPQELEEDFVAAWLSNNKARLAMVSSTMLLDGEDITGICRTAPNDIGSSHLAQFALVRAEVNAETSNFVAQSAEDLVATEGRNEMKVHSDLGTLAFGVYLTASPEVRAKRRAAQRSEQDTRSVLRDIARRDHSDMTRAVEPLCPAYGNKLITVLGVDEVPLMIRGRQLLIPTDHLPAHKVLEIVVDAVENYRVVESEDF